MGTQASVDSLLAHGRGFPNLHFPGPCAPSRVRPSHRHPGFTSPPVQDLLPCLFLGPLPQHPAHTQPHPPVWSPFLCLSHRNCLPRSHLSSTPPPAQETSHRVGAGLPASAQRPYLYPGLLRPPARKWGWLPPPVLSSAPHPTPQEPSPASLLGLHVLSAPASVWKLPALWSLPPLPLVIRSFHTPLVPAGQGGPVTGCVCRRREPSPAPRSLPLLCSSAPCCLANSCGRPPVTWATHPKRATWSCLYCLGWLFLLVWCLHAKSLQSCPTLCDPMDCM